MNEKPVRAAEAQRFDGPYGGASIRTRAGRRKDSVR